IQLHSHCLAFEQPGGEAIPCSAEQVTVEVLGEAANGVNSEIVRHAAATVLYYFKNELGRTTVTMGEFIGALEKVLRGFGLEVKAMKSGKALAAEPGVAEFDLRLLTGKASAEFELDFFPRLREELRHQLEQSPRMVRFCGLRPCVKRLAGRKRWCPRCHRLSDQIVGYLRECLHQQQAQQCALVVL
ncbi:MAG: hypothetical protein HY300_20755, partial [Verrucomicrobia bacterium]|nr:hypothetical protein [Verrucomicrobiota bacterium]